MAEEKKPLSRSERESQIKDKAGWVITVLAALLAINTYIGSGLSSKILNNTIKANDTWAFYQSKSIKQTLAEQNLYEAKKSGDKPRALEMSNKIERYENEPKEGKRDLMAKARALEAERDEIRKQTPWLTFAGSVFQIAIVLLTASILAVAPALYVASIWVGGFAALLMSQGLWLWIPIGI
jgi:hypothetical protein